jgi:hypothetical protein
MATGKYDPAFPKAGSDGVASQRGMTMREYYAGQALVGLLSNETLLSYLYEGDNPLADDGFVQKMASGAVRYADALIAELDR